MTDPHQNNPQRPEGWPQNPYGPGGGQHSPEGPHQGFPQGANQGPNQGFPAQPPAQPGGYGQPGPQYMPDQPGAGSGGPTNPGSNSTKVSIVIIATMVLLTAIATVLYFVVRDDNDDDGNAANQSGTAPTSVLGDDTLSGDWSDSLPESGGEDSLDPRWSALLPASLVEHLEDCRNTTFPMNHINDPSDVIQVDGASCYLTNVGSLGIHQVDILAHPERVAYLESAISGEEPGKTGEVFRQEGSVTVGISNVEPPLGVTLYYLDSSTDLAVEMMNFTDATDARSTAEELGIL